MEYFMNDSLIYHLFYSENIPDVMSYGHEDINYMYRTSMISFV